MAGRTDQEDLQWIQQSRDGDKAAFAKLVRKYEPVVASTVTGMLGYGEDAEDVGQMVFIRFYNALKDFRGEAALATYLTRISINLSLNEIKKRNRRNIFVINRRSDDPEPDLPDERNESQAYDAKEAVNKALQKLEPKFRSVVVLRMLQGYSTTETAKMLKIPAGTVLSRLARAQDKLKEILKHLFE